MTKALLLLDVTHATVRSEGSFSSTMQGVDFPKLRERLAGLVKVAREAGIVLVWVVPGEGFISRYRTPEPIDTVPDPDVGTPADAELVVHKAEIGGFENSDLDGILRSRGVTHVILAGVATQYVIALTAREAASLGYKVTVLEDACADLTPEAHSETIEALRDVATISTTSASWA